MGMPYADDTFIIGPPESTCVARACGGGVREGVGVMDRCREGVWGVEDTRTFAVLVHFSARRQSSVMAEKRCTLDR